MAPPTCPITGTHLRYLLLTAILCYLIYFLYDGISHDPTVTNVVYICDTPDEMIQCTGLDDVTTCQAYNDSNGKEANCIESSCGYKLFDHIDISIAGSSDPLSQDAATASGSFVTVLAVAYSLVPYAIAFVYCVLFLITGSLVPLNRFVLFGAIAVLNEAIFKRIVQAPRPEGSCLYFKSFGMPSGHAETSIGLLTYILLEMFVYHPNILCGLTCQKDQDSTTYEFNLGYGWLRSGTNSDSLEESAAGDIEEPLQPSSPDGDVTEGLNNEPQFAAASTTNKASPSSKLFCHICALLYTIIFLPVPFSRVYLHDHYQNQVIVGSCIGILVSLLSYLGLMRGLGLAEKMRRFAAGEWGSWWGVKYEWDYGFL